LTATSTANNTHTYNSQDWGVKNRERFSFIKLQMSGFVCLQHKHKQTANV